MIIPKGKSTEETINHVFPDTYNATLLEDDGI